MKSNPTYPRMHASFYVKDLAETVNFYTTFFGQPAEKVKKGYAKYILESPALVISFLENPERVQSNFGHLGFQIETKEEMMEKLETAKAQGIVSKEEIGTACCYAVQDKFWVTDPNGIQWEVYYFHEDSDFNDPHYEAVDASACCMPAEESQELNPQGKIKVKLSELETVSCDEGSGCC
ncbi:MAG: catechol 2,3-dioxygenase-like lactoylglutathione lyase family enzyme [Flammeovirgaceae bacterium]|jgi:catechol 2,3-dioxygenase-like lactoylglutathione lyase family enzyme